MSLKENFIASFQRLEQGISNEKAREKEFYYKSRGIERHCRFESGE